VNYYKSPYRERPGDTNLIMPKISLPGRSRYSPKDFATGIQRISSDRDFYRGFSGWFTEFVMGSSSFKRTAGQ